MGQLTVYIDDPTLERIESAAHLEKESVSKWVKRRLAASLDKGWPTGYFDVFGSLKDASFSRPAQPAAGLDRKRAAL